MSTAFAGLAARSPYEVVLWIEGGTGTGNILPCLGKEWVVVQVKAGELPTMQVEGTVDGNTWYALRVTNMSTGAAGDTISESGLYQVRVAGLVAVRASEEASNIDSAVACAV